jgi:hypothetical protein
MFALWAQGNARLYGLRLHRYPRLPSPSRTVGRGL